MNTVVIPSGVDWPLPLGPWARIGIEFSREWTLADFYLTRYQFIKSIIGPSATVREFVRDYSVYYEITFITEADALAFTLEWK